MKLFKIEQSKNDGYDTYDCAVVAAKDADEARLIHPSTFAVDLWSPEGWMGRYNNANRPDIHGKPYMCYDADGDGSWAHPDDVTATLVGTAKPGTKRGVIVASFNAG